MCAKRAASASCAPSTSATLRGTVGSAACRSARTVATTKVSTVTVSTARAHGTSGAMASRSVMRETMGRLRERAQSHPVMVVIGEADDAQRTRTTTLPRARFVATRSWAATASASENSLSMTGLSWPAAASRPR